MSLCPCGSGGDYAACCEPIISGSQPATTAEALMRARYSAHVKVAIDFIFESMLPAQRDNYDHEGTKSWAETSEWLGLEILATEQGQVGDEEGRVEFVARFRDSSGLRRHHEQATFQRVDERWYFVSGTMVKAAPAAANKVGRNDPCPCGSGKKFKKCCG